MYRTQDDAFMTNFRHRIMTNTGTEWLADRRWALRYFQKYLQIHDLQARARVSDPLSEIPMGSGGLDASVAIVTLLPMNKGDQSLVRQILADTPLADQEAYTAYLRRDVADPASLLQSELEIVGAQITIAFGVFGFLRGIVWADVPATLPVSVPSGNGGVTILLPDLTEFQSFDAGILSTVQKEIKRSEKYLTMS